MPDGLQGQLGRPGGIVDLDVLARQAGRHADDPHVDTGLASTGNPAVDHPVGGPLGATPSIRIVASIGWSPAMYFWHSSRARRVRAGSTLVNATADGVPRPASGATAQPREFGLQRSLLLSPVPPPGPGSVRRPGRPWAADRASLHDGGDEHVPAGVVGGDSMARLIRARTEASSTSIASSRPVTSSARSLCCPARSPDDRRRGPRSGRRTCYSTARPRVRSTATRPSSDVHDARSDRRTSRLEPLRRLPAPPCRYPLRPWSADPSVTVAGTRPAAPSSAPPPRRTRLGRCASVQHRPGTRPIANRGSPNQPPSRAEAWPAGHAVRQPQSQARLWRTELATGRGSCQTHWPSGPSRRWRGGPVSCAPPVRAGGGGDPVVGDGCARRGGRVTSGASRPIKTAMSLAARWRPTSPVLIGRLAAQ